jgi:hypothetical protein
MTNIDFDENLSLGAQVMQSAAMELTATKDSIVNWLEQALTGRGTLAQRFDYNADMRVQHPDNTEAFTLPIHIKIDNVALASTIVRAADGDLRIQTYTVVSNLLAQPRIVLQLQSRVVGQLHCSRDGQAVILDIKELPGARDLGNGVLALDKLKFNVHTPFGWAWAD